LTILLRVQSTNVFYVAGVGVYISRVEENSVAEHVGLRPGDSILEVNGMPFGGVSHDEALKVRFSIFPKCLIQFAHSLILFTCA